MDNEEFSPIIDKSAHKKSKTALQGQTENLQQEQSQRALQEQVSPAKNPRKKAKFGLKPFAFFSGVVDILVAAAVTAVGVFAAIKLLTVFDTGNEGIDALLGMFFWPFVSVVAMLFLVGAIMSLISGIMAIVSSFKSDRRNFNGVLITATVLDFLLAALILLLAAWANLGTFAYVLGGGLGVATIFKIVEIVLTKRRLKKYQKAKAEEYQKTDHTPNFANLGDINGVRQNSQDADGAQNILPQQQGASENGDQQPGENNSDGDNGDTGNAGGVDFSKLGK